MKLAECMVNGVDPIAYLNADDFTQRALDQAMGEARRQQEVRDQNLAVRIINQLSKAVGK